MQDVYSLKGLPIGIDNFKKLRQRNCFLVDKSLFIKEIIDDPSEVILITRPRRFGKSLNLSMLQYFFEKNTENHAALFADLDIWRQDEKYRREQGQYPVIKLTFKDIKHQNYQDCLDHLQKVLGEEFLRHKYILTWEQLDESDREEFIAIKNKKAGYLSVLTGLNLLIRLLGEYHQKEVYVLIDEYDTPVNHGYLAGYFKAIIDFMRGFLGGGLKDNRYLKKAIITGIYRVAKESIYSDFNNFELSTIISNLFADKFGFTPAEVGDALVSYHLTEYTDVVKEWYNGYTFGDNTVIYNPWSILKYLKDQRLEPHWVNTSSNDLVKQVITKSSAEVKQDLEKLIQNEEIIKPINDHIVFGEIEHNTHSLWSFLLFSGYLRYTDTNLIDGVKYCSLEIPNQEVRYFYHEIITGWFEGSITGQNLSLMLHSLTNGDIKTFGRILKDFVAGTLSYFDTGGREPEKVYHAFVLGLLINLTGTYEVKSNRESGYGRYDVMVIPKNREQAGIIMEFKKADPEENEDLAMAAEAALRQIEEKEYERELKERGVGKIIKLGIAFLGKDVLVREGKTVY